MWAGARRLAGWGALVGATLLGCHENVYLGDPIDRADRVVPDGDASADVEVATDADTGADIATVDSQKPVAWYLHAVGSKIFDSDNVEFHLKGISWSGMQTAQRVPDGLQVQTLETILTRIDQLGFNLLRIPFCSESITPASLPGPKGGVDSLARNPTLTGFTSLEVLDRIIDVAAQHRLRVVLDHYRFFPGDNPPATRVWFTGPDPASTQGGYPESAWTADWVRLASRYLSRPNVVGFELHDEIGAPSTWGDDSATDWRLAAERAGNEILKTNPNLVVLVPGIDVVNGARYWPGGNLRGANAAPVRLTPPSQLIYSIRDYGRSVDLTATWLADLSIDFVQLWNDTWGNLVTSNTTPVIVGAFTDRKDESDIPPAIATADAAWREKLVAYIAANQLGFVFWSVNPSAEGKPGLLDTNWRAPNAEWSRLLGLNPIAP